ncbi:MAG: M13 family metallopeptidase N-terminal domain-containing protein, partial [Sphingomicrobium sp.]
MNKSTLLLFASALALSACGTSGEDGNAQLQEQAQGSEAGINLAAMDKNAKPGDDFYNYANGAWLKNTQIPEDRSSFGAFNIADKERERQTKELFDTILRGKNTNDSTEGKIANYYKAYLNTDAIEKAGMAPVKADLDGIASIADKRALSAAIGSSLRADTDPLNATNYQTENLFGVFVTQGLNTPGETLPYLMQGGIGLPEREYYIAGEHAGVRGKYKAYMVTALQAAGYPDPQGAAGRIMDLETKIATAHATREESEDFAKGATVWSRAELEKNAPGIDWGALLGAAQLGQAQKFQAYHSGAIPKLAALVGSEPIQNWKDWLAFHLINQNGNVLPKSIRDPRFAFFGTELQGTPKQRPRDQMALNAVGNGLQDLVGKAYVDKYFPASSKTQVQGMVDNIKAA